MLPITDDELVNQQLATTAASSAVPYPILPIPQSPEASSSRRSHQRTLLFLGAPTIDRISTEDLLDESVVLQLPPYRFLAPQSLSSNADGPEWRILHRSPKRLETGFTQNTYPSTRASTSASLSGPTPPDYAPTTADSPEPSHFSRQTGPNDSFLSFDSEYTEEFSTTLLDDCTTSFLVDPDERPPIPPLTTLTDLEDIPRLGAVAAAPSNSLRITSLVTVLSISQPRPVSTKFRQKAQVVTLTVGDPTRAPFRIDVWLVDNPRTVDEMELRAVVRELRVQDVIVVKNLRLAVWKDTIFANTWKVGSAGGSSVWLVYRLRCEDAEERRRWRKWRWDETVPAERKVARTIKWAENFVGVGSAAATIPTLGGGGMLPEDTMPPDTPDVSF
ncbi:hypothetical protein FN846DRAFT_936932 [Sphaerosporella brunnea]|uniref:Uncharacterized protein n=1 Tax=Sphaerosporella brunnea TaxID=1250544 RepID=A0A5J5F517_9PEZI|nr:hypothetical protein FN846DRAFT_936932 [Sphaerosporella brunnea]